MAASHPDELQHLFAERANACDLDGLVSLYEDGATFVGPDGVPVAGRAAIRGHLQSLLVASPHITPLTSHTVLAGDVALICSRWRMTFGADRTAPGFEGTSREVTRRQADGSWLYVIDDPSPADTPPEGEGAARRAAGLTSRDAVAGVS